MSAALAARVAAAEQAMADLSETGGDWAQLGSMTCCRLPVDFEWAAQAKAMTPPTPATLTAALSWLSSRSRRGGSVTTRAAHAHLPVFTAAGLRPAVTLAAMVQAAPRPGDLPPVTGLTIGPALSATEFLAVYQTVFAADGGPASGRGDLAPMVTSRHLAAASYQYLVGRLAGEPVGCAQVRWVAGTSHVQAVGVLPGMRGRGVGSAITAAACGAALERSAAPIWLHAGSDLQSMYRRLGFWTVDEHVQLRVADG